MILSDEAVTAYNPDGSRDTLMKLPLPLFASSPDPTENFPGAARVDLSVDLREIFCFEVWERRSSRGFSEGASMRLAVIRRGCSY
jgi:hypothetical protein